MSQPNVKCAVCGSSNFITEAGFFFCSECNTQSQDIREEVFDDYFGAQKVTTRVLQKKTQSKTGGQDEKLTSWEILNYVLKGITEELIELGAKPFLKIVVLQLWASYLKKLEIAFTSVEIERKPKLGYAFKRSDASIIYGLSEKELKEKSWRSRSRSSSVVSSGTNKSDSDLDTSASATSGISQSRRSILRRLTMRKKALASAEYSQQSQDTAKSFSQSQTLEQLDSNSEAEDTPKRLKVTKHAKSILNSSCASSTEEEGRNIQRRLFKRESVSLRNVTMAKLVALVNIALAINKEEILLSDFLRLVEEGRISLRTARKFLPAEVKLDSQIQRLLEVDQFSYVKCKQLVTALCCELDIQNLPQPDLARLTDRYCMELQLPDEVSEMTTKLLELSLHSNVCKSRIHESKYPEVQVMSAIVVVMKLLFSLDGCTEYRLSHTAAEINRRSRLNGDGLELFVFTEWVQYIECRKAVISSFHLPTRIAVYGNTIPRDTELFLKHYSTTVRDVGPREANQRYMLDKRWVEAVTRCLQKLVIPESGSESETGAVKMSTSLTPLYSGTQLLLTQYPERVSTVRHLLDRDFTKHSLLYTTQHDRCIAIGLANDLNIIQQEGAAATFRVEQVNSRVKSDIVIPRCGINKFNVKVNVVKRIKHNKKISFQSNEMDENRLNIIKDIISDESEEEEEDDIVVDEPERQNEGLNTFCSDIDLYKPCSQYWFCHTKLSKNDITLDEFDVFSKKMFSSSFLWLLNECSRTIKVSHKDLYANIISIESKYQHILNSSIFVLTKGKTKRR